jgi:hypothetical protein
VKSISVHACGVLLLLGGAAACGNNGGSNGGIATSTSDADLRPAPDVSTSAAYALHSETPTAGGKTPVASSKQYLLVLGRVANDNH